MNLQQEADKIRQRYYRRVAKDKSPFYSAVNGSAAISFIEKYFHITQLLYKFFGYDFTEKFYLEVGCGTGTNLLLLLMLGIPADHLAGNDIFAPSLQTARIRLPEAVRLEYNNFLDIKYVPESCDCIFLSTVLSSILDKEFQKQMMQKCYALLKPNGYLLIYDFVFDNPRNPDVKGISLPFLRQTEKWRQSAFKRVTLAPPIARRLSKFPLLINILTCMKFLNTHIIGFLQK
ncbi:MAG: class I SAM-dependent methyltransferase [Puniceicoccales bacterium]|jgi:SAM-dependent methyltransferase|nr:class I SAM-dependent methyltransferase [Puniceicoccales bacterium]